MWLLKSASGGSGDSLLQGSGTVLALSAAVGGFH